MRSLIAVENYTAVNDVAMNNEKTDILVISVTFSSGPNWLAQYEDGIKAKLLLNLMTKQNCFWQLLKHSNHSHESSTTIERKTNHDLSNYHFIHCDQLKLNAYWSFLTCINFMEDKILRKPFLCVGITQAQLHGIFNSSV
ncbi:hypothetical protein LOAG_06855 [Loa loa]|uniref:Uncharacterized protein n=1 Tax=Loa loa TaxID=7209 RepID=A0A1S0TYR5_LOALO|nr:hypothetical protein LOAG_06855 [Loa loa]EFO21631.1 hypothetical protein LOAG_06855 [Loa loa]